jgi:predicted GNAT family acetyltransferase
MKLPTNREEMLKVFCPTGEGGGIDPTCSPRGLQITKHKSGANTQLIAKKEGKEIGEIVVGPRPDGNYEVKNILVWPKFQRQGYATNLYQIGFQEARLANKKLYISSDLTEAAKSLHRAFRSKGILQNDGEIVF